MVLKITQNPSHLLAAVTSYQSHLPYFNFSPLSIFNWEFGNFVDISTYLPTHFHHLTLLAAHCDAQLKRTTSNYLPLERNYYEC